jgi:hypothetical protein
MKYPKYKFLFLIVPTFASSFINNPIGLLKFVNTNSRVVLFIDLAFTEISKFPSFDSNLKMKVSDSFSNSRTNVVGTKESTMKELLEINSRSACSYLKELQGTMSFNSANTKVPDRSSTS